MKRPVVLGLTTSTEHGDLALVLAAAAPRGARLDGRRLAAVSYMTVQHAERLMPNLDRVLEAARCTRRDLVGVACDIGPGSFTGVRVGVSCAKGIALALGIPLVGVVSLQAMAHRAFRGREVPPGHAALPMIDAKRGEVFAAAYDAEGNELLAPLHVRVEEASSLLDRLGQPVVAVGLVARTLGIAGVVPEPRHSDFPDAVAIASLGADRIERAAHGPGLAAALDPAAVEPLYVRAPDAKPAGVVL